MRLASGLGETTKTVWQEHKYYQFVTDKANEYNSILITDPFVNDSAIPNADYPVE